MPRGRPKKSLVDHVRDGTYRRDRHGPLPGEKPPASVPLAQPPSRPQAAPQAQSELWDQLTRLLAGVVTDRDVPILTELCWWWTEFRKVQADLATMAPGEKGYKDKLVCAGICSTNLDKLAVRFGLTPVDRARLKGDGGPPAAKVPTRPRSKLNETDPVDPAKRGKGGV